jgi:hypothetical protein
MSGEILNKLNSDISKVGNPVPRKPFSNLDIGRMYIIKNISIKKSIYGNCILATLFDEQNLTFNTYLPRRCVDLFPEDLLETINKGDGKYAITYLGQSDPLFQGAKTRSLLRFDIVNN